MANRPRAYNRRGVDQCAPHDGVEHSRPTLLCVDQVHLHAFTILGDCDKPRFPTGGLVLHSSFPLLDDPLQLCEGLARDKMANMLSDHGFGGVVEGLGGGCGYEVHDAVGGEGDDDLGKGSEDAGRALHGAHTHTRTHNP